MEHKAKQGWHYDKTRNNASKRHNLLIPYSALPDVEQEKDRSTVQGYEHTVALAGYCIRFIEGGGE